ncbi:hypothetical protein ACU6U9_22350 [Pseudomonas sp. HK3]
MPEIIQHHKIHAFNTGGIRVFAILLTEGMDPFYQNITSFPTVIFTFLLIIAAFYWAIAVLGVVSLDILDFDLPEAEADTGFDNASVLAGVMMKFGLYGVPVTIILSFVVLFGWLISYYSAYLIFSIIPSGFLEFLVGIPIFIGSLYLAVLITSVLIRPMRSLFKNAIQETAKYVLGQTAVVRTSRVDENFGEAVMQDGGAGLILKIRSEKGTTFTKGEKVVVFEYIAEKNVYRVISQEEFNGK